MIKLSHYRVLFFVFSMSLNALAAKGEKRALEAKPSYSEKAKKSRSTSYHTLLRAALLRCDTQALHEILTRHRERFFGRMSLRNWTRLERGRPFLLHADEDNEEGWSVLNDAAANHRSAFLRLLLGSLRRAFLIDNPSGGNVLSVLSRREIGARAPLARRIRLSQEERRLLFRRDNYGINAMEAAVMGDSIECMEAIFEFAGEFPELIAPDEQGRSILIASLLNQNASLNSIRAILRRVHQFPQLLMPDREGASPLHHAFRIEWVVIGDLMALGAQYPRLRLPLNDGTTLLSTAAFGAITNQDTDSLEWLLERVTEHPWIVEAEPDGSTVLHRLALMPVREELRISLDSGEEVPAVQAVLGTILDQIPRTPVLLLANARGETALYLAALCGHERSVLTFLEYAVRGGEYLRLLARTNSLETALDAAAIGGHVRVIETMLSYADRLPTLLSNLALRYAVRYGHFEAARALLQHAERFPVLVERPADGETALHTAVSWRNIYFIRLLMSSRHVAALMGTPYIEHWRFLYPPVGFRQIWLTLLPFMPGLVASLDRSEFRARFPELFDSGRIEAAVILGDLARLPSFLIHFAEQFDEILFRDMLERSNFQQGWRFALTRTLLAERERMRQTLPAGVAALQVLDRIIDILLSFPHAPLDMNMGVTLAPLAIPVPLRFPWPDAKHMN